jgi:HSP20 family protein
MFPELAGWPRADVPARFGRVFDELMPQLETISWSPAVDIIDRNGELLLTAEIPGMTKDQVHIEVSDGVLTLKGEKKEEKEEKQENYRLWERSYGAFERTFTLPRAVAADRITAEYDNGVLKVHLPKTDKALGKKIEIGGK